MSIADKLTTIAENEQKVYDKGRNDEWKAIWDIITNNNERTNYSNFFNSAGDLTNLRLPYTIKVTNAQRMFYNYLSTVLPSKEYIDMSNLPVSGQDYNTQTFGWATKITEIPDYGIPAVNTYFQTYIYCRALKTIELIRSHESTVYNTPFTDCNALQNITFEGVIGRNISFSSSPLSVESMKSIITHLKDYSGTSSEYSYTLTLKEACIEALEAEGNTSPNGNSWIDYIDDLKWNLT